MENHLSYWRRKLSGVLPEINLPLDYTRPVNSAFRGKHLTQSLPADLSLELKTLSKREGCTVFMTLLAAFQLLLSRYSKQEDILTGTAIANRNRGETEALIGFFINMLVMRTNLSGTQTFRELIKQVRDVALGAYAHQDVPFEKLVEEFARDRNTNRPPLVQVAFGMNNFPKPNVQLSGLSLEPLEVEEEAGRFDLTLWLADDENTLVATWYYNTELFKPETIQRIQNRFETLLRNIVAQPNARLSELEMLSAEEKAQQTAQRQERENSLSRKLQSSRRKPVGPSQIASLPAESPVPPDVAPTIDSISYQ
jgi:non-ribosomal peptide synthetase component F